jgi:hypothetical protein
MPWIGHDTFEKGMARVVTHNSAGTMESRARTKGERLIAERRIGPVTLEDLRQRGNGDAHY